MRIPICVAPSATTASVSTSLRSFPERGKEVWGSSGSANGSTRSAERYRFSPDIAILDISMPLLNGLDAARELKKRAPRTKVILLTRHDEAQYVTEALRVGVK